MPPTATSLRVTGSGPAGSRQPPPTHQAAVGQQHVGGIVHHRGQVDAVDGHQVHDCHLHPRPDPASPDPECGPSPSVWPHAELGGKARCGGSVERQTGSGRGGSRASRRPDRARPPPARSRRAAAGTSRLWSVTSSSRPPSQPGASASTGPHAVSVQLASRKARPAPGPTPGEGVRQAAVIASPADSPRPGRRRRPGRPAPSPRRPARARPPGSPSATSSDETVQPARRPPRSAVQTLTGERHPPPEPPQRVALVLRRQERMFGVDGHDPPVRRHPIPNTVYGGPVSHRRR